MGCHCPKEIQKEGSNLRCFLIDLILTFVVNIIMVWVTLISYFNCTNLCQVSHQLDIITILSFPNKRMKIRKNSFLQVSVKSWLSIVLFLHLLLHSFSSFVFCKMSQWQQEGEMISQSSFFCIQVFKNVCFCLFIRFSVAIMMCMYMIYAASICLFVCVFLDFKVFVFVCG